MGKRPYSYIETVENTLIKVTNWLSISTSPTFNGFYEAWTNAGEKLDVAFRNGTWWETVHRRTLIPGADFTQWRGRDVSIGSKKEKALERRLVVDRGARDALRLYRHFACEGNVDKATYYFLVAQRLQAKLLKVDKRIYKLTISGMENLTGLKIRTNVDKVFPPIPT